MTSDTETTSAKDAASTHSSQSSPLDNSTASSLPNEDADVTPSEGSESDIIQAGTLTTCGFAEIKSSAATVAASIIQNTRTATSSQSGAVKSEHDPTVLTTEATAETDLPSSSSSSSSSSKKKVIPATSNTKTDQSPVQDAALETEAVAAAVAAAASSPSSNGNDLTARSNMKAYKTRVQDGSVLTLVDVVLGRGGLANNHPGNKDLLGRIKDLQTIYKKYSDMNKQEKHDSTRLVFDWIGERGGRFLKKDPDKDCWREVDKRQAYNKVMHMFRDDHTIEGRARKRQKYSKYSKHKLPPSMIAGTAIPSDASKMSGTEVDETEVEHFHVSQTTSSNVPIPADASNPEESYAVVTPTTQDTDTSQICEKDVLFGRGGHANNNVGNRKLLEYIKSMQYKYKAFGNSELGKKQKKDLTLNVVHWVRNQGGRFLKRDKKDGPWEETTNKDARLKVSQLFRNDHTPEARLRKRKKYSGDIWSKTSPDEATAADSSIQDNDESAAEESMDDQKPAAVDTPSAIASAALPNPASSNPVASVAVDLSGMATLAANGRPMAVGRRPTEGQAMASVKTEGSSSNPQVALKIGQTTSVAVGTPAVPPPKNPMAPANPIANVTLPEGAFPSFKLPYQYFSMGMHQAHAYDALRNPMQHFLPQPAMMNTASENLIAARIQAPIGPSETPTSNVVGTFTDNDVLLGRGGHANHHPGNKMLLDQVKMFQPTYKSFGAEEDGKKQKNNLTRQLVEWVRAQGGRFLKRSAKDVPWREVSYNEARMKVSHLFRNDHTPEGRERKRKRYAASKDAGESSPKETEKIC